jgi:predicted transcriptional regulator
MTCLLSLEEKEFRVGVGNRTRVEIIASMLNAARDWTPKTHIMYRANLSHRQLRRYLTFILDNGLLEKAQSVTYKTNLYHITEKGLSVLRDYFRLSARLNGGPPQRPFRLYRVRQMRTRGSSRRHSPSNGTTLVSWRNRQK